MNQQLFQACALFTKSVQRTNFFSMSASFAELRPKDFKLFSGPTIPFVIDRDENNTNSNKFKDIPNSPMESSKENIVNIIFLLF